jgi:hypothetical protein
MAPSEADLFWPDGPFKPYQRGEEITCVYEAMFAQSIN